MKTIAEQWKEISGFIPKNASPVQVRECRRFFYAGFLCCLSTSTDIAVECRDSDDIGATMLKNLHDECTQFALDMNEGRA